MPLTYPRPDGRPLVLAHRGASAHADDNSARAFQLAVDSGADGVELDVRFTSDEAIVLSHDPVARGSGLLVEHSHDELIEKHPGIITLDQAAEILGDLIINVEIKNDPSEPDFDPDHRMADRIASWVAAGDRYGRVAVTSFNPDTVARVRFVDGDIVTGQLLHRTADLSRAIPQAADDGHNLIATHRRLMRASAAKVVEQAAEHDLEVFVWTVDNPRTLRRLGAAGVAAVIPNDPAAALAVFAG
ncbi:MAG: glycerophosphodiester phosphodiesterase [Acidimicrobiia bacterium]|nr:glycerophosphodiester phosphodiesterase [Acidimicrobiia bacterium]